MGRGSHADRALGQSRAHPIAEPTYNTSAAYNTNEPRLYGVLDGGSPMSHVDFKKWQCRMSLSLIFFNVTG